MKLNFSLRFAERKQLSGIYRSPRRRCLVSSPLFSPVFFNRDMIICFLANLSPFSAFSNKMIDTWTTIANLFFSFLLLFHFQFPSFCSHTIWTLLSQTMINHKPFSLAAYFTDRWTSFAVHLDLSNLWFTRRRLEKNSDENSNYRLEHRSWGCERTQWSKDPRLWAASPPPAQAPALGCPHWRQLPEHCHSATFVGSADSRPWEWDGTLVSWARPLRQAQEFDKTFCSPSLHSGSVRLGL